MPGRIFVWRGFRPSTNLHKIENDCSCYNKSLKNFKVSYSDVILDADSESRIAPDKVALIHVPKKLPGVAHFIAATGDLRLFLVGPRSTLYLYSTQLASLAACEGRV